MALKDPVKRAAYKKAWAEANRERMAALQRAWYVANKEKCAATSKAYRTQNHEKSLAYGADYYKANKEVLLQKQAVYQNKHKEARRGDPRSVARVAARRSRLRNMPKWADNSLVIHIYSYAAIMRKHGVNCHVDHIVPLHGKRVSGLHTHENLTVLLAEDNRAKAAKFNVGE